MYTILSTPTCGYCTKAKDLLKEKGLPFLENSFDTPERVAELKAAGYETVPVIFLDNVKIGGFEDLQKHLGVFVEEPALVQAVVDPEDLEPVVSPDYAVTLDTDVIVKSKRTRRVS